MFSDVIQSALEREIVGQPRAVNSIVRGVTRVFSGVTPRERTLASYLLMGPTGTGKTHLIHTLARIFHGDESRVVVADCTHFRHGDPWITFAAQMAPLFEASFAVRPWAPPETPPLSMISIEALERGPEEFSRALASALETGQAPLAGGRSGSLRNCLIFITSGLCSREILDEAPQIGFSGSAGEEEDEEQSRVYKICAEAAEKQFGNDLVGRLDGLIIFRGLSEEHLGGILERRFDRLCRWLAGRGFGCELLPAAGEFLIERGRRDLRLGARDLVRAHKRFVEFPIADLMVSGRIPSGGLVTIDRLPDEEHLHFTVTGPSKSESRGPAKPCRVAVEWEGEGPVHRAIPRPPALPVI